MFNSKNFNWFRFFVLCLESLSEYQKNPYINLNKDGPEFGLFSVARIKLLYSHFFLEPELFSKNYRDKFGFLPTPKEEEIVYAQALGLYPLSADKTIRIGEVRVTVTKFNIWGDTVDGLLKEVRKMEKS